MATVVDMIEGKPFPRREHARCPLCGKAYEPRSIPARFGMTAMVAECKPCRIAYQTPVPTPEASAAYMNWRWSSSDGYVADKESKLREARRQLEHVERAVERRGTLLDFGAGNGAFVRAAIDAGWDAVGVEQSEAAVKRAREFYDVEILTDLADAQDKRYDVITMWDVVEHLREPQAVLEMLRGLLAPGGVLVMETGNWESYMRLAHGHRWMLYILDHQYYFSPSSLKRVSRNAGFGEFELLNVNHVKLMSRRGLRGIVRHPRTPLAWLGARTKWPEHGDIDVMVAVAHNPG